MLLRCTILLCLLSAAVTAQQLGSSDITSRTELASALVRGCGNDLACSDRLLDVHRDLVSKDLWQDVVSLGDARAVSSSAAYAEALQIASKLNDKRLAGLAYYKLGWYEFGEGKISDAILSLETCRLNSEPIDPPAPVTKTTRST